MNKKQINDVILKHFGVPADIPDVSILEVSFYKLKEICNRISDELSKLSTDKHFSNEQLSNYIISKSNCYADTGTVDGDDKYTEGDVILALTTDKVLELINELYGESDSSKELTIYTDEDKPIKEALDIMTEDWIDNGNYSDETVLDLVNACKKLMGYTK